MLNFPRQLRLVKITFRRKIKKKKWTEICHFIFYENIQWGSLNPAAEEETRKTIFLALNNLEAKFIFAKTYQEEEKAAA